MDNILRNFFWFCSGANFSILKKCPTDHSKFVGIGATVFATGFFAMISGGYALYFVFNDAEENTRLILAIFFGICWGLMIFNLDRYIVSSMKKQISKFEEFKVAIPRLLFAFLIAMVMSKPLELQIFHTSIEYKLSDMEQLERKKIEDSKVNRYKKQMEDLNTELARLQVAIDSKKANYDVLIASANCEADGTCGSMIKGKKGLYLIKKAAADEAYKDFEYTKDKNQPLIETKNKQLDIVNEKLEIEKRKIKVGSYDGFDKRLSALGIICEENYSIYTASMFLMLLFMALEMSPIFVKLLSPRGAYDDILELKEHSYMIYKIEKMSMINQKTNERLQIVLESSNSKVREELDGNSNLMKRIIEAEQELAQEMINQWKNTEMDKLKSKKGNKS